MKTFLSRVYQADYRLIAPIRPREADVQNVQALLHLVKDLYSYEEVIL